MIQKFMRSMGMLMCILFLVGTSVAYAGQPLSTETDYKPFGSRFNGVMAGYAKSHPVMNDYLFDMIYPETAKKERRLMGLGLSYDNGTLFFLETKIKNTGVYLSFNDDGYLDALLLETSKENVDSYNRTLIVLISSLLSEKLLLLSSMDQSMGDKMRCVVNSTLSYFDVYSDKGFYVRIKDVSNSEFYRVAIFRPEVE